MLDYTRADHFLENVMELTNLQMGGARGGIIGSISARDDLIHRLKQSAIVFTREYRKREVNRAELNRMAEEMSGYLQTLQLLNSFSESTVVTLMNELSILVSNPLV